MPAGTGEGLQPDSAADPAGAEPAREQLRAVPRGVLEEPHQLRGGQPVMQGRLLEEFPSEHAGHYAEAARTRPLLILQSTHLSHMSGMSEEQRAELEKRIPKAIFLENIEEACREGTDPILAALDQQYNRYRLAEGQLLRAQQSMTSKIPQIEKTIQMIQCLASKTKMDVDFLISEGIFVRGKAKDDLQHVSLWLGANTIVELTFEEAADLLKANLGNAISSLSQITEELAYIKDQKTTTEVNVARVYNHSLALKREQQIARSKEE